MKTENKFKTGCDFAFIVYGDYTSARIAPQSILIKRACDMSVTRRSFKFESMGSDSEVSPRKPVNMFRVKLVNCLTKNFGNRDDFIGNVK